MNLKRSRNLGCGSFFHPQEKASDIRGQSLRDASYLLNANSFQSQVVYGQHFGNRWEDKPPVGYGSSLAFGNKTERQRPSQTHKNVSNKVTAELHSPNRVPVKTAATLDGRTTRSLGSPERRWPTTRNEERPKILQTQLS